MSDSVISGVVAFCGSLIPIGVLVWKLSAVVSQVKQNTGDINHIADKVREAEQSNEQRFDELDKKLSSRNQ